MTATNVNATDQDLAHLESALADLRANRAKYHPTTFDLIAEPIIEEIARYRAMRASQGNGPQVPMSAAGNQNGAAQKSALDPERPTATRLYDGYVTNLAKRFDEALSEIQAGYNFEYGPEFEVAICKTLRRALPHKYGICRGFVVDASGEKAGDDIIIYDRARFSTLRLLSEEDYSCKERIPIEATYAYIEAKHTIDIEGEGASSLRHAVEQISRVRALCARREPVPLTQINQFMVLPSTVKPQGREGYPQILNPLFTMILARHVRQKPKQDLLTDPKEIERLLTQEGSRPSTISDTAILGRDNVVLPVLPHTPGVRFRSPFFLEERSQAMCRVCPGLAFGIGLCMLLFALDEIQLGKMSWTRILQDAVEGGANVAPAS